jgi:hypothetical protein
LRDIIESKDEEVWEDLPLSNVTGANTVTFTFDLDSGVISVISQAKNAYGSPFINYTINADGTISNYSADQPTTTNSSTTDLSSS